MKAPPPPLSSAAASETDAAPLQIERGYCFALFAYDIGLQIDLDDAQRRISAQKQRETIRHRRKTPTYFEFQPQPLRFTQTVAPVGVAGRQTSAVVDVVLYDFGAASLAFAIPLEGTLRSLLQLADELWDHPELLAASRSVIDQFMPALEPAIGKPGISAIVEDYVIYQIEEFRSPLSPAQIIESEAALIARILRAEDTELSRQEIAEALHTQLSFAPTDRAVIDWNAALLLDPEPEDVRAVLEFANVELLESRYLDDQLDDALDQAYEALARRRNPLYGLRWKKRTDLWQIAQLQMDYALLFEGVNNALKLLGDQYLARMYRLTSERFHLGDWDASILRKLETIESIYQKMSDRQAAFRMELLEWIIIILIAVSILLPFIPGVPGY